MSTTEMDWAQLFLQPLYPHQASAIINTATYRQLNVLNNAALSPNKTMGTELKTAV